MQYDLFSIWVLEGKLFSIFIFISLLKLISWISCLWSVFNYDPNTDSVLQVTREEYENCSNSNPVKEYKGGKTKVELDRSGPFYFISKAEGKCKKGQRLTVIVLSHGHRAPAHSPLPAPELAPPSLPSELAPTALAPAPLGGGANGVRCGFIGLLVGIVSLVGMILNWGNGENGQMRGFSILNNIIGFSIIILGFFFYWVWMM